jgi:hypothetical protein
MNTEQIKAKRFKASVNHLTDKKWKFTESFNETHKITCLINAFIRTISARLYNDSKNKHKMGQFQQAAHMYKHFGSYL